MTTVLLPIRLVQTINILAETNAYHEKEKIIMELYQPNRINPTKIILSMSRRGKSHDNALAENFKKY